MSKMLCDTMLALCITCKISTPATCKGSVNFSLFTINHLFTTNYVNVHIFIINIFLLNMVSEDLSLIFNAFITFNIGC